MEWHRRCTLQQSMREAAAAKCVPEESSGNNHPAQQHDSRSALLKPGMEMTLHGAGAQLNTCCASSTACHNSLPEQRTVAKHEEVSLLNNTCLSLIQPLPLLLITLSEQCSHAALICSRQLKSAGWCLAPSACAWV